MMKKLFTFLYYTVLSMFSSLVRLFLINPWLIPQRIQLKTSVACKCDEKGKGCLLLQRTGFLNGRAHRVVAESCSWRRRKIPRPSFSDTKKT